MVRMGDLSWDAFEPSEGQFEFAWFDDILKQMNQAGIKVVLDIGGSPAPIWLHHKYPSVNMVNEQGATVHPAERYMDDISDPAYREHLIRFADELTRHYADNPALAAIGYNNEIGNGVMSYSEGDRQRFIAWLKAKYGTIENLNKAWATQRWSRHLNSFDEVQLPYANGPSPPERYLDLHRFWSDVTVSVLDDLEKVRERNVPNLPAVSNLWDTAGRRGFDYLSSIQEIRQLRRRGILSGKPARCFLRSAACKGRSCHSGMVQRIHYRRWGNVWRPERHYPHVGLSRPNRLRPDFSGMDLQHASGRRRAGAVRLVGSRWHALVEICRVQADRERVLETADLRVSALSQTGCRHCVLL